ncbi:MAG: 50S ribosomal protein L29 [Candidatus Wolfebacteria bacterium GW2011_GWC1_37_10]|uniref:Large ribosomal subunit protein uL29 n=1 Tax=Candidatus Wolfebacteria bacterium GW2011_GWC1_37_10 TaxID=1619010 RepID=A0A0G0FZT7_9BACT|nr:MAG: 50S ribosomal protein L29 [Candidatus Wolfebacteria bacterium GW2011_GWC1_37_10]
MKKQEFQQLKSKPLPEIQKDLTDYKEKLRQLKFDLSLGKVKNISEIRKIKKTIARIMTISNKK